MEHKSYTDYRITYAHSYEVAQDTTFRTPVETLMKHYEPFLKKETKERKQKLLIKKTRGDTSRVKEITITTSVRRKLNKLLPQIKEMTRKHGKFTAAQFAKVAEVQTVAANKYLDILEGLDLVRSDNKAWSASYRWNDSAQKSYL